jgi:hypothetical protein
VFALTRAALLDAAEAHDEHEDGEHGERADDDAGFGAAGEGGPVVADAGGGLDFGKDGGGVRWAAAAEGC